MPTEVHLIKTMVFQVVMYGCETWTIKLNTEELKLSNCGIGEDSRVPWTARSNQSILKEVIPEYSLGRTDAEAETPILWPPDAKN